MIDQWLPAVVITAVNLLIMWGTMRYAERGYRSYYNAQQATCRATVAATRAERAAGIQSPSGFGKAAAMGDLTEGMFVVVMDETGLPADIAMENRWRYGRPGGLDLETIGTMMSVEVTEISPGVLRAGEFEIQLSEGGIPRAIRRHTDGDGS